MKKVFLVSLNGTAVHAGHQILGFISNNNKELIANFLKNMYKLTLQAQLPNKFTFQNGNHWEYLTNNPHVNIHVDVCYNLDENGDE